MKPVYIEFGGGLGDVFNQLYWDGGYRCLSIPNVPKRVGIVSHNHFVSDLFEWHPQFRKSFDVELLGYWLAEQDAEERAKRGLCRYAGMAIPPEIPVQFYPSPVDPLPNLQKPYVILAPNAGQMWRDIPAPLVWETIQAVAQAGFQIVQVGRNYNRCSRTEERRFTADYVLDTIDQLSVPGTAIWLQQAAGLITAHSSLNLLAWHMKIPQLLFYPEAVREIHFMHPDPCSFGAWNNELVPLTVHDTFENSDWHLIRIRQFVDLIHKRRS